MAMHTNRELLVLPGYRRYTPRAADTPPFPQTQHLSSSADPDRFI
jgi:hypothetical protein